MYALAWELFASHEIAFGLYTHPFFGLTLIGHAAYVGLNAWVAQSAGSPLKNTLTGFAGAISPAN